MPSNPANMPRQRISRGKPSPLTLSSLILLSPESALKFDDLPIRGLFEQSGNASLYKVIKNAEKKKSMLQTIPPSLKSALCDAQVFQPVLANTVLLAFSGDPEAKRELDALGHWAAYRRSRDHAERNELILIDQYVKVEAACLDIDTCLTAQRWADAADLARLNPLVRPYLGDAALDTLAGAKTFQEELLPRFAGLLEFLLSQIALFDHAITTQSTQPEGFEHLLVSGSDDQIQPGRGFVHWFMRRLGVDSLSGLLDLDSRSRSLDESTLKRWSSAAEFPSEGTVREFVEAVLAGTAKTAKEESNALWRQSSTQYWAARRLNRTLKLAEPLFSSTPETSSWGTRLLGAKTAAQWARQRYSWWHEHWRRFEG